MRKLDPSKKRVLNNEERTRIQRGFNDWRDRPSRNFREVLQEFGLNYEQLKNCHYRIWAPGVGTSVIVSSTPSDRGRFAKQASHDIINYIEKYCPEETYESSEGDNYIRKR